MKQREGMIHFHYLDQKFSFRNRNRLKAFLLDQLRKEGKAVETINYIFCNDAYLLEMNQTYLNHDTLTDIITFELSGKGEPVVADIFISIERIRENASAFNVPFQEELLRVIFHGALHLAGYKDKRKADTKRMREKEEAYLAAYNVSRDTVST
jgi:probable rRNA maturation factor